VRGPIVGEKIPAIDGQRRDVFELFPESFYVADTPCQSAHARLFSATGLKASVNVSRKMDNEAGLIVGPEPLRHARADADDLRAVAGGLLRRARYFACDLPAHKGQGETYSYKLDYFDPVIFLHNRVRNCN
jgi:hypothetical protein